MPPTTTTLSLDDLLGLASIKHHPRVRAANAELAQAQGAYDAAQRRHADAQAEQHAAEAAAAAGRRDERRLSRAQAQLETAASDVRIAGHAVERQRAAVTETLEDACREVDHDLRAHYRPALEALDRALAEAKRASDAVLRIEDASRALLAGGPYRTLPGSALSHGGSWAREFGIGSGNESRYSVWRHAMGLHK